MQISNIPQSIQPYVHNRILQPFVWQDIEWRVPYYQVYAKLENPVSDRVIYYKQQKIAVLELGRYEVPLFDPCHGGIVEMPAHAVVLSICKGNRFGLFAYPAQALLPLVFEPWGESEKIR
ncbi:hypothetical protein DXV75_15830 [Alteromonas aestuariivivens]|uniref:Uncharacterized protein n=1 Tax=Alteromonas aestuariivivens TaxID=1938339 RepID=A0A3D8M3C6_9ALTE|nr:hypothetical protein [Alteromonas aestuariivivens]RDV24034.1 hypothetical protein DXV75_15830 [Alteromonas aestuariivivens]